jgi:hypothetical protein
LEDLEKANDLKTPQKVRLIPGFVEIEDTLEVISLKHIETLNLTDLQPLEDDSVPTQKAVYQMFEGWEIIKVNLELAHPVLGVIHAGRAKTRRHDFSARSNWSSSNDRRVPEV